LFSNLTEAIKRKQRDNEIAYNIIEMNMTPGILEGSRKKNRFGNK